MSPYCGIARKRNIGGNSAMLIRRANLFLELPECLTDAQRATDLLQADRGLLRADAAIGRAKR